MTNSLDNILPNHVVDYIYYHLHKIYYKSLLKELKNNICILEKLINISNENVYNKLEELYQDINIEISNYESNKTIIISINNERFFMYHYNTNINILFELYFENNIAKIERFYLKNHNKTYLNIEDYLVDYQQINIINDTMNYDYKYHSNKYWQNPEKVIKWFKELYQFLVV